MKEDFFPGRGSAGDIYTDDKGRVFVKRKGAADDTATYVADSLEDLASRYPREERRNRRDR